MALPDTLKAQHPEEGERPFSLTSRSYEEGNLPQKSHYCLSLVSHWQDWAMCLFWNQTRGMGLVINKLGPYLQLDRRSPFSRRKAS